MLPKKERLKTTDFKSLKTKMVFRGTYVDIAVSKAPQSRFACVISKKRIKKAVDRNNSRRKVYSIIQEVQPRNPHLVVLYPKITTLSSSYSHIKTEIQTVFDTL
jgi:ribonuclease P protein component